jgi:tetratricopeptide (TPR) repeat protein
VLLCACTFAADPASFERRKQHIRTLLDCHDFQPALDEAKAINREWADDITAYQLMAEAHLGLGNYSEAESALQWMLDLRIGKADARGWVLVARFREVTGDIDGAIDAVNLAFARLAPREPLDRGALLAYAARLEMLAGRLDTAEQLLRQAPAHEPYTLDAMARLRLAQDRPGEAAAILRELIASEPAPRYLYRLAGITQTTADYAAFERSARTRIASPDNANRELALYLAGPGKRAAEALDIARTESKRRHDVFTMEALAVALFANSRVVEARSVMNDVLAVGTRDPEILAHARLIGVKPR